MNALVSDYDKRVIRLARFASRMARMASDSARRLAICQCEVRSLIRIDYGTPIYSSPPAGLFRHQGRTAKWQSREASGAEILFSR
jgi:hypothetical protein